MVAETDGSNVMGMQYLRGVNLLANKAAHGTKSYYLYNAHGDVVGLSNGAGEVTRKYEYDAFGNEKVLAGQTEPDANPFRYCGEYTDDETEAIYLRERYYDPAVGRFTQLDPANDGLNWYTYCGNNPLMFVDPNGMYYIVTNYYYTGPNADKPTGDYTLVPDSNMFYWARYGFSAFKGGSVLILFLENQRGVVGGSSAISGVTRNTMADIASLIKHEKLESALNVYGVIGVAQSIYDSDIPAKDSVAFSLMERSQIPLVGSSEKLESNIQNVFEMMDQYESYFYNAPDGYNTIFTIDKKLSQSKNVDRTIGRYKANYFAYLAKNNPNGHGHMSIEEMNGYTLNYEII